MNKIFTFARETSLGRALIPIGLILAIFGIITLNITRNSGNYIKTDAVVTRTELNLAERDEEDKGKDQYDVYVKYTADGKEYEQFFGTFPGYKEGDSIKISYNPDNPEQFIQDGNNTIFSLAFIAAGIIAIIGGIVSLIKAMQKHRRMKLQEEEWTNGR